LLLELKRVYPDDIIGLINKLPEKKNRNSCKRVLEYQLESESEEEEQHEQEFVNKPTKSNYTSVHKPLRIEEPKAESYPINNKITTEIDSPSKHESPVQKNSENQLERNLENITSIQSKPQMVSAKSKPFNIKETPKKISESIQKSEPDRITKESPRK
jgi:hypothetical protein